MTHEQINRIRAMVLSGIPKREIASRTGFTYSQVRTATEHRESLSYHERTKRQLLAESDDPAWRELVEANF